MLLQVEDCMSMTLMVEKLGLMRMHNWNQSLRHKVKKPAGTVEEVERHFGCESARLIMVGDRLFTDIVYGNRTGFFMILPEPLSLAEEPLIGRLVTSNRPIFVNECCGTCMVMDVPKYWLLKLKNGLRKYN
ncbi:UNVERIFIED_CONTAM: hypothetical protein Sradi_6914100 [Sesamum radiatum]|uniref:Uncharacterized protein n=1 Tax=Sesamum radiatum TaxID=300843 RepID=A0AAW2JHM0_SESRA